MSLGKTAAGLCSSVTFRIYNSSDSPEPPTRKGGEIEHCEIAILGLHRK